VVKWLGNDMLNGGDVMAARKPRLAATARALLAFAEQRALQATDWVESHNALFGLDGKATELLTTEEERTALARTAVPVRESRGMFASGRLAQQGRQEGAKRPWSSSGGMVHSLAEISTWR
jgi:hypothetical protein